jgi:hypothetical protein
MKQHVEHRKLLLSRPGITEDNVFQKLLTQEFCDQDPVSYFYLAESMKFNEEYNKKLVYQLILQRYIGNMYLVIENHKNNINILGKYNLETLLHLLEIENGLKETVESVDSEMQQKMIHFNEIYKNIIENKTILNKKNDNNDIVKRYSEIENYLINKD